MGGYSEAGMRDIVLMGVCIAVSACSSLPGEVDVQADRSGTAESLPAFPPVAEDPGCLWRREGVEVVLEAFRRPADEGARARAEAALDRHLVEHRWGGWIGGRHPIPFEPGPVCDAASLERLVRAARTRTEQDHRYEVEKVAMALERNARPEEARDLRLGFELPLLLIGSRNWHERQDALGNAAARQGRWEWAYYHHSNGWSGSFCGLAIKGWLIHRDSKVLRDLAQLERWDEVRAVARPNCGGPYVIGSACYVEWILEAHAQEGNFHLAEAEFADLCAAREGMDQEALERARQHWEIRRLPDSEALLRLDELASRCSFDTEALRILRAGGSDGIRLWIERLDGEIGSDSRSWWPMVYLLARTGDAAVGEAFHRWGARFEDPEDTLGYLVEEWERAAGVELTSEEERR